MESEIVPNDKRESNYHIQEIKRNSAGPTKLGYIKCRLIHLPGARIIQPDILFSSRIFGAKFWVPTYFDPCRLAFLGDNDGESYFSFTVAGGSGVELLIVAQRSDLVRLGNDGSAIYRCRFAHTARSRGPVQWCGKYLEKRNRYLLRLYHHTTEAGRTGILSSGEIWSSFRNIKGDRFLNNIAYGYFTDVTRIQTEEDLLRVAMSSSGLTGLLPINAPESPNYARIIEVPQQQAADLSCSLRFWIDAEFLAPNHIWVKRPAGKPAYYEIVLPNVFRVGCEPGENLGFTSGREIYLRDGAGKRFEYVVAGDGDTHDGLVAPYHEEETASLAHIEQLAGSEEIISCWHRKANTDQYSNRRPELAELRD